MSSTSLTADASSLPRRFDRLMAGDLLVSTGENVIVEEHRVLEPFKKGLTVAVALQGEMTCRIDDRHVVHVRAPSVSLILAGTDHRREQVFAARQRLRYALVHLSPRLVESHLGLPFGAVLEAGKQHGHGLDPAFIARPADTLIRSVASQLLVCPFQGAARSLYLIGKGLELVALTIDRIVPQTATPAVPARLSSGAVERLTAARTILLGDIAEPPPLPRLAASVGLSPRALTLGFKRLFDATVPEFIQEQRLQLAYRLIANGQATVAETAYKVGYTPAYLSTLFRSRFGLPPSALLD